MVGGNLFRVIKDFFIDIKEYRDFVGQTWVVYLFKST
jgi:hypothetical protein